MYLMKMKKQLDSQYNRYNPSNIKISVMSGICSLGVKYINLETLENHVCERCGVLLCKEKNCNIKKPTKNFYNQKTVLIRMEGIEKVKNVKLFKNGKAHLSGLNSKEQGMEIAKHVIMLLKQINKLEIEKRNRILLQNIMVEIGGGKLSNSICNLFLENISSKKKNKN